MEGEAGDIQNSYKALTKTGEDGELCGEAAALLSKRLATIKTDIPLDLNSLIFPWNSTREGSAQMV